MKKILFLIFSFLSFSNADYLVSYNNGKNYCTSQFSQATDNDNNIFGLNSDYNGQPQFNFIRNSIISIKTGYEFNNVSNTCEKISDKENYEISEYIKLLFKYPNLPSLTTYILALDKGTANNLFNIKPVYKYTFQSGKTFCTTGYGHHYGSDHYIYSPEYPNPTYNFFSSGSEIVSKIQFNYTYNYLTKECFLSSGDTAYDLPNDLGTPTENFSSNTPTQTEKFKAYYSLFESANNLPNPNPQINDIIIDTTSSSLNCNNSFYTLQDKLLCEMNAGIRKLNQESNPKYSLNNLISILITSNDKNSEETNKSIKAISSFEEVRLQKQLETNTLLTATKTNQDLINTNLLKIDATLKGVETDSGRHVITVGGGSSGGTVTPEPQEIDLDKYFKPDENINLDDLNNINNDTDSIITTLFTSFTDFKTNITDSFDSINNQLDGLKETIQNPTNIFTKNTIINCPVTYKADFSSFGLGQKSLIVDYCEFTSRLQPIVYFFTYVTLLIGLIFFSFRFIGVLI